jgi:hypothetical protein
MRLIHTFHKSSGISAKVFYSADREKYTVRFYVGAENFVTLNNFTHNRGHALDTAELILSKTEEITQ